METIIIEVGSAEATHTFIFQLYKYINSTQRTYGMLASIETQGSSKMYFLMRLFRTDLFILKKKW